MKFITALLAAFWAAVLLAPFARPSAAPAATHWVGSWAASQQIPEPRNALPAAVFRDATLRQIVPLSLGGHVLRVHFSNAFGTAPLHIAAAHIARAIAPGSSAIDAATDTALTFGGRLDVVIPEGTEYVSDPVRFAAADDSSLAISLYLDDAPQGETSHPGSRATSYLAHGDVVSSPDLPRATTFDHWFQIAEVDVKAPRDAAAVVILGDSIADGHASTTNGNDRWSDDLARRIRAAGLELGVLNHGIGGNRLLQDGLGPNALARFDRDVLAQSGVRYLIVHEGINDIGTFDPQGKLSRGAHEALVQAVEGALEQIIVRAHAAGIAVYGGTLTPFVGSSYYRPKPISEADREAINRWIRQPGHFDAVIDFDAVMRDPARPDRLRPSLDSGDHLHPSPAGYRAMADAVPLSLLVSRPPALVMRITQTTAIASATPFAMICQSSAPASFGRNLTARRRATAPVVRYRGTLRAAARGSRISDRNAAERAARRQLRSALVSASSSAWRAGELASALSTSRARAGLSSPSR